VLTLLESHVGDALQQLGVVRQALGVAPGDLVGAVAEVIIAERLEPSKHLVDLGFSGDERGQRIFVFDQMICFRGRVLIFKLQLDRRPDECFFRRD
jgi:hypothetical protein